MHQKIPYADLLDRFPSGRVPYELLLSTNEWQNKRDEILERDNYACTKCGKSWTCSFFHNGQLLHMHLSNIVLGGFTFDSKPYILHIHHKYYVIGRLPWEYKNDELQTLCNWCHEELHTTQGIVVLDGSLGPVTRLTPCTRCGGKGWFPEFTHIEEGICFRCFGEKYEELIT